MANDPLKPQNDGKIGNPRIDAGMNKLPPSAKKGGKGSDDDDKNTRLGADKVRHEKVLARARKRLEYCIQAEGDNRSDGLDDDKFWNGDQWPADIKAQRNFERRPCLTT